MHKPAHTRRQRLLRRIRTHHIPLLCITAAAAVALYAAHPGHDWVMKASFATAYPAALLIAATLVIGPVRVLARRRNPVSRDLRRDVGIWAGTLSVLHAIIGQCVHLRGRPWLYYVYGQAHRFPLRHDLFGFANFTGLAATLLILALLATSNDCSLRRLGTPRWKSLQRWNYAVFALVAAHTTGYLIIEKQKLPFVLILAVAGACTLGLQSAGLVLRRCENRGNTMKGGA